jgi:tetratricopeptide (TPR) repeat protein
MQEGDFQKAVSFLEAALKADKTHRGIVKNLGYSYLWLGQYDQAQVLLERLPEARLELTAYAGWWKIQGRNDLAAKAAWMSKHLSLAN